LPDTATLFFEIADGQIDQLGGGVIGWKAATSFGGFSTTLFGLSIAFVVYDLAHRFM